MIKTKCKHEWKIYVDVGTDPSMPSVYKCDKCAIVMTATEVFQLETLKHVLGFRKWLDIIAICIAVASLIVSVLVTILK